MNKTLLTKNKYQVRLFFYAIILLGFINTCAVSKTLPIHNTDPFFLYGSEIHFDVFRSDEKVGFHSVNFLRDNDNISVKSIFKLKIDLLFFTAFFFEYESSAIWKNGQLNSITAITNDNGETYTFDAYRKGSKFTIKDKTSKNTIDLPVFPTNHWNSNVIYEKKILNTLTGKINSISIEPISQEKVNTEHGEVMATRYQYSGDLNTEVWYSKLGRWVKMRFEGRDGSTITYKCKKCLGPNYLGKQNDQK